MGGGERGASLFLFLFFSVSDVMKDPLTAIVGVFSFLPCLLKVVFFNFQKGAAGLCVYVPSCVCARACVRACGGHAWDDALLFRTAVYYPNAALLYMY